MASNKRQRTDGEPGKAAERWSASAWLASLDTNTEGNSLARVVADALLVGVGCSDASDELATLAHLMERCPTEQALANHLLATDMVQKLVSLVHSHLGKLISNTSWQASPKLVRSKFAGAMEAKYAGLDDFFGGLEGQVGAPQPNALEAIEAEHLHRDDSLVDFLAGNYGVQTTSTVEWFFVVEPTPERLAKLGLPGWPVEADDRMPDRGRCREPCALDHYLSEARTVNERLAAANQPALLIAETVAMRFYTGPLFVKYNGVLRGLHSAMPHLRSELIRLCASVATRSLYETRMASVQHSGQPSEAVREVFEALDPEGSGLLDAEALPTALRQLDVALEAADTKEVSRSWRAQGADRSALDLERLWQRERAWAAARAAANPYVTTLHAINSGIVKVGKIAMACKVYRGIGGVALPVEFWEPNEFGVRGGVEKAFLSTTTSRRVAMGYASGRGVGVCLEIMQGSVDRGANLSFLSQYPHEEEILFGPLSSLEVQGTHVEDGIVVIRTRLSVNLQALTLEQVVSKMQRSHDTLLESLMGELRLVGAPERALRPLAAVRARVAPRGREFFNLPSLFQQATAEALEALATSMAALGDEVTWSDAILGTPEVVAARMRAVAEVCARKEEHALAASLLILAVQRCPAAAECVARVAKWCDDFKARHVPTIVELAALQALDLLLESGNARRPPWPLTVRALAVASGEFGPEFRLCTARKLPVTLIQPQAFDTDATAAARKGSALLSAATAGDDVQVKACLSSGCDPDECFASGVTPLMLASRAGSLQAVVALLEGRANPSLRSERGCTALGLSAEMVGAARIVASLLQAGADPNTVNEAGVSPLMDAAKIGENASVRALAAAGADLEVGEKSFGATPLAWAVDGSHLETCHLLLELGANIDKPLSDGRSVLTLATMHGNAEMTLQLLKARADPNLVCSTGETALLIGVGPSHDNDACVRALVNEGGVDVDQAHAFTGLTALMVSCQEGRERCARALIELGAHIDRKCKSGTTALFWAKRGGHVALEELLRAHGAAAEAPSLPVGSWFLPSRCTVGVPASNTISGSIYYEIELLSIGRTLRVGWASTSFQPRNYPLSKLVSVGDDEHSWGIDVRGGKVWHAKESEASAVQLDWQDGDVFGCAIDEARSELWVGRNGHWLVAKRACTFANRLFPVVSGNLSSGIFINGQSPRYAGPGPDFVALCGEPPFMPQQLDAIDGAQETLLSPPALLSGTAGVEDA